MPPNMRIQPTGFASLRSARLRLMREPLGADRMNFEKGKVLGLMDGCCLA